MVFLGDVHGNFNYIKWWCKQKHLENANIIQVGDFGIGFNGTAHGIQQLEELQSFFKTHNIHLYVVRGNHDNPGFFNGEFELPNFGNVHLVPDYTVIEIEGKNVLFVGGATSIDRSIRRKWNLDEVKYNLTSEKRHYWYDEVFEFDEDKLDNMRRIDIVVTHTAPDFCKPHDQKGRWPEIVRQFFLYDPLLEDELVVERMKMTKMYEILKKHNNITDWVYGHFHQDGFTNMDNTLFTLLGVNKTYEIVDDDDYVNELNKKYGE